MRESFHFIVSGEFITKKTQAFVFEKKLRIANELLDSMIPKPTFEQRQNIIKGNAQFIGNTLCDDLNCKQCLELRPEGNICYIEKPDENYQKKITKHKEYLDKFYFEIDKNVDIKKATVANLIIKKTRMEKIKQVRYNTNKTDYDESRILDKRLASDYINALDEYEFALDNFYNEYEIKRNQDYPIGSEEWQTKNELESIMDVIKAKSNYNEEIQKLIRECINTGTISAMASEKLYASTQKINEDESLMGKLADQIERPKKAKPTKETIQIGDHKVPKNLIEDYVNSVNMSNSTSMIYKARYGKLDPLVEQRKLETRIELHKNIFKALKLPYHQDIDRRNTKLTKKELESLDFQEALREYLEN